MPLAVGGHRTGPVEARGIGVPRRRRLDTAATGHTDIVPQTAASVPRPTRSTSRRLSLLLSGSRAAVGIAIFATADRLTEATRHPTAASVLARAFGARDVALGVAALAALRSGRAAGPWTRAGALADLADCSALAIMSRREPARALMGSGAAFAAAAALAGFVAADGLSGAAG